MRWLCQKFDATVAKNTVSDDTPVQITMGCLFFTNFILTTTSFTKLNSFRKFVSGVHKSHDASISSQNNKAYPTSSLLSLVYVAKWHTQTARSQTHLLSDWKRLALALNRWFSEDFSLSFIHDNVRTELPLTLEHLHTPIPNRITLWISNWLLLIAMCSCRVKNLPSVNITHLLIGQSNYGASLITYCQNSIRWTTITIISQKNNRFWWFVNVVDFILIK